MSIKNKIVSTVRGLKPTFIVPCTGIFICVFLITAVAGNYIMTPDRRLLNISYPYTLVNVISADSYVLENSFGQEKTVRIDTSYTGSFYNAPIEKKFIGMTVYYKNNVIYYLDENNKIQALNYYINNFIENEENNNE